VCYLPTAGGFCTIESSKQNTTKTARPAATIIGTSSRLLSPEQFNNRDRRTLSVLFSLNHRAADLVDFVQMKLSACGWVPMALIALTLPSGAKAQSLANVIFLEAVDKVDTRGAEVREKMPLYRAAADPAKYLPWLENQSAQRALRLYRAAYEIAQPDGKTPDYYVALVPGGNHAAVGFRLQTGEKVEELPRQPYILLDAQPYRFDATLLHETGHVAMALVAGGRQLEGRPIASIPHSTSTLSDRTTAFTEGYAIHLETLAAHLNRDQQTRQRFHRELVLFGDGPYQAVEYFHHSVDLTSYSQNVSRYLDVRDNNFSFESAFQGADYLRAQLEKARDFASVRDANQLLQSEGFYASFFFLWTVRGTAVPNETTIAERERQVLMAMHTMFAQESGDASTPWLLRFAVEYMKQFPDQKAALADAINDSSHGVFMDGDAARLWKDHYLAALQLDQQKMNVAAIQAARKRWHDDVMQNPHVLWSRLGPEIPCQVPGTRVKLAALGEESPVRFDINTAPGAILRLIPGIGESEVASWIGQRSAKPFTSIQDFQSRAGLRPETAARLKFD
jgi:DNA uptake protein ComE-like DNA-binding protein